MTLKNFVLKNLQNKNFCIKLHHKCYREILTRLWTWLFILLLFTHMKMKKLLLGIFFGIFTLAGIAVLPNVVSAAEETGQTPGNTGGDDDVDDTSNPWFEESDAGWWKTQKMDYNANVAGSEGLKADSLIHTIRTAINWVLGILSMIALALCLWGGFQMMTSGGDQKKYESGLGILKWAAIGLAIIAASWLIVSLIFFVINGSIKWGNSSGISGNTWAAGE